MRLGSFWLTPHRRLDSVNRIRVCRTQRHNELETVCAGHLEKGFLSILSWRAVSQPPDVQDIAGGARRMDSGRDLRHAATAIPRAFDDVLRRRESFVRC